MPHRDTLTPGGQALVEEVEQLAGEVLAPEKDEPVPVSRRQALTMRKAAGAFYAFFVVLALVLGAVALLNNFSADGVAGLRFFVEPTDAMLKQVPRGSLLITVTRPSSKIKPGDIITYYAMPGEPDTRLTRIVDERLESNGKPIFRTKRAGDAAPDSMLINMTHILGVKLAVIPGAGFVFSFIQAYGWGLAILAAAMLISAVLLRRWAGREHPGLGKKKKKRKVQQHAAT